VVSARECREDYCSIRFHGMMSHNTRSPFRVRAHACHVDCCSTHSRRNLIRNRRTFLRPSCVHVSCAGCCSIHFQKRMIRSICIDSYIFIFVVNRPGFVGHQQERASLLLPNAKVSDGSQPPRTAATPLGVPAGARSLDRLVGLPMMGI
jgi:hypothetical protein